MKISDIISHLEEYDPNDSVVISWHTRESFDPNLINKVSQNDWEMFCESMDYIGFPFTDSELENNLKEFLKGKL